MAAVSLFSCPNSWGRLLLTTKLPGFPQNMVKTKNSSLPSKAWQFSKPMLKTNLTNYFSAIIYPFPITKTPSCHFMQNSLYTIMHTSGIKSEQLCRNTASNKPISVWREMFHCLLGYAEQQDAAAQRLDLQGKPHNWHFQSQLGKMDTHLAFILKEICLKIQDSFLFCISGILHSNSAYKLGNKILLPLCRNVIKGLFVLMLCGSLNKVNFPFPYNVSCVFRNYKYPWNNPVWDLLISDTYFPQKHSRNEREIAFHKGN